MDLGRLEEEFAWTFDLISDDPQVRRAAIGRQQSILDECRQQLHWMNAVYWRAGGTFSPQDPALEAELWQARQAHSHFQDQLAYAPVSHYLWGGRPWEPVMPYVVMFLRREALFPQEWGRLWITKRHVLQRLGRTGPTPDTHDDLVNLVAAAIWRRQRCEDGFYARVARTLDRDAVRAVAANAEADGDENTRCRAGYIKWALDNPSAPISLGSWRHWTASRPRP